MPATPSILEHPAPVAAISAAAIFAPFTPATARLGQVALRKILTLCETLDRIEMARSAAECAYDRFAAAGPGEYEPHCPPARLRAYAVHTTRLSRMAADCDRLTARLGGAL